MKNGEVLMLVVAFAMTAVVLWLVCEPKYFTLSFWQKRWKHTRTRE